MGALNTRRLRIIRSFQPLSRYILETVQISPRFLWIVNSKSQLHDQSVSVQTTLRDLERRNAGRSFAGGSSYARSYRLTNSDQ